jgi:disulfide bond formation protein DsbB
MQKLLQNPRLAFFSFAVLSASALAAAYISQYAFGLQPCTLCHYQRIPYAIVIGLCILGIAIGRKGERSLLALTALSFLANAGIAFYHTGVERHWWKSFLEGCAVPSLEGNIADVMARLEASPPARCDDIPWADPVLGLSMANYNVIFCLMLAAAAIYAATRRTSS